MKKMFTLWMTVLLLISLCACSSTKTTTYTVTKGGTTFIVNTENSTISDGTNIYMYSLSGNLSDYDVDITYPDGSTYWWSVQDNSGMGGWSDDYDENRYIDGNTLCKVLEEEMPEKPKTRNVLIIILLLSICVFNVASPYTAWYLEYGWRYKDAEPSDIALGLNRFCGILAIIIAVIMIIV